MPKGIKNCPNCHKMVGAACISCPYCDHAFKKVTTIRITEQPVLDFGIKMLEPLGQVSSFCKAQGGYDKTQKILNEIKRLGGIDNIHAAINTILDIKRL